MGSSADNCKFLQNRFDIFWGGFSMIKVTIDLIRFAVKHGHYDRFVLLSDDSAPICSLDIIADVLSADVEFIATRKLEPADPFYPRYKQFFYLDHAASMLKGRPIESSFIDDNFIAIVSDLNELRQLGKVDIPIYSGSQWWALSNSAITYILFKYDSDLYLRKSFQYSAVPDEMYFQTLLMNSPFKDAVRYSLTYVDWSRSTKPHVFSSMQELLACRRPTDIFARKIDESNQRLISEIHDLAML
jgi:hypothetical protein